MTVITHDQRHCHCSRCERINHSPSLRAAIAVAKYGAVMAFSTFAAYHLILWAASGFVGFN